jgi:hypothetical protein
MPKRGKRNSQEQAREHQPRFVALRRKHSAIESDINCLEHHAAVSQRHWDLRVLQDRDVFPDNRPAF